MVDMLPEEKHGFYVEFELRAEEDRNESMKTGYPVFHDIEIDPTHDTSRFQIIK